MDASRFRFVSGRKEVSSQSQLSTALSRRNLVGAGAALWVLGASGLLLLAAGNRQRKGKSKGKNKGKNKGKSERDQAQEEAGKSGAV